MITIASLSSIIGLGILKMLFHQKGFKFSCSNGVFKLSGRVGDASTDSTESIHNHRQSTRDVP